jgi:hypothetical protein
VPTIEKPQTTVKLSFEQDDKIGDGTHMMLQVSNPFPRTLKYRARMMTLDGRVSPTSSCPIRARTQNYEHWPHPIFQLIISDLHFVEEGSEEARRCKY